MANKNFKARIGIEAPLIAADNGTTAITLSDNDVTVVGDLTVTSNTIKSSSATAITLSGADVTAVGDLAVNGGDLTTTQTTGNLFNATATTVNVGNGATTEVNLGNVSSGRVQIKSPSIVGANTTQAVFNTVATTVNAFGDATTVSIGANTGTTTINNDLAADSLTVTGDLAVNGGDITTTATTATLFNANATTVNIGAAATTMSIGNGSGTVTIPGNLTVNGTTTTLNTEELLVEDKNITMGNVAVPTDVTAAGGGITLLGTTNKTIIWNNATDGWELNQSLKVTGDVAVNGGDITTTQTTGNLFNTTATTINIGNGADTELNLGSPTGGSKVYIKPDTMLGISTTQNVFNTVATTVNAFGAGTAVNIGSASGTTTINNDLDVKGGDISNSTGALSITTGASDGAITLDPNGTGDVILTFANGGNLFNDRNYVMGIIRDATTEAAGDVWSFSSGTSSNTRGISVDNSVTPSKRPGVITRAYSANTSTAARAMTVTEVARGNPTSGLGAVQSTDRFCEITAQGYNGTAWTSDVVLNNPFTIRGQATEAWSESPRRAGSKFLVIAQPSGIDYTTTSTSTIIDHNPLTATYIADSWTFKNRTVASGGTNVTQLTIDTDGNVVVTGDLTVTGNDIKSSSATAITLSGADVTVAGDLTVTGNDIKSSSATALTLSGTDVTVVGDLTITGNDINSSSATAITLSGTDVTVVGDLAVNGGDITTTQTTASVFNTTATTLNIGGGATLATNIGASTGSVVNGPNRFTSPTINAFLGSTATSRGLSISNGNGGAGASARNSIVLRTYPTSGGARGQVLFENARGTENVPSALLSGDFLGETSVSGYATNGWVSDYVTAVPGVTYFTPTENWANTGGPYPTAGTVTNAGLGYVVALQPTATNVTTGNGTRISVLNINPQTFTQRSDAFTWTNGKTGTTQTMALDVNGNLTVTGDLRVNGNDIKASDGNTNITLTSNTLTAFAGDIRVNGNDIQASDGANNITLTSNTLTAFAGDIKVNGDNIQDSTGINALNFRQEGGAITTMRSSAVKFYDENPVSISDIVFVAGDTQGSTAGERITQFSLYHARTNSAEAATSSYFTWPFDHGTGNFSPIGANEVLGRVEFGGTYSSGSSPNNNGASVSVIGQSAETFSSTANGGRLIVSNNIIGTTTPFTSLLLDSNNADIAANAFTLKNSGGTALNSGAINYSRTYGEFTYNNAAGFGFAAQDTIYLMPLDTTNYSNNTSISNTSRINISSVGKFKIIMSLQAAMSTNSVGQFEFWLRKNGTDVANSATQVDLLKDQKSVIAMDWMVDCDGSDYWEVAYATINANYANITFPTIAAQSTPYVRPLAPAVIFNVIPIGA